LPRHLKQLFRFSTYGKGPTLFNPGHPVILSHYSSQSRKARRVIYFRKISNDRRRQRLACCRLDGNERSDVAIKKEKPLKKTGTPKWCYIHNPLKKSRLHDVCPFFQSLESH
jgi:hypothetical protein